MCTAGDSARVAPNALSFFNSAPPDSNVASGGAAVYDPCVGSKVRGTGVQLRRLPCDDGEACGIAYQCVASRHPSLWDLLLLLQVEAYLNRADVQAAIHVEPSLIPTGHWSGCSNAISYSRYDLLTSMLPIYREVMAGLPDGRFLVFRYALLHPLSAPLKRV